MKVFITVLLIANVLSVVYSQTTSQTYAAFCYVCDHTEYNCGARLTDGSVPPVTSGAHSGWTVGSRPDPTDTDYSDYCDFRKIPDSVKTTANAVCYVI
jgi:hypothetical protein